MNKLQQRVQQRGQGGFTLIELLVVIAILAILAGVVVFAVGNSTDNAKSTACKAESKTIRTAFAAAKAERISNPAANITGYVESLNGQYFTISEVAGPPAGAGIATTAAFTALPTGHGCTAPTLGNY